MHRVMLVFQKIMVCIFRLTQILHVFLISYFYPGLLFQAVTSKIADPNQKIAKSKLDSATQSLIKLIFDNDMFRDAMKNFEIDVKKMPLGKLSKPQIAKVI